ncbi:DUF3168 domain-containing protein [Lipingzhangella sp. LS1_29]|uniref:DUF3168 domain-containing protein n=1 Tax=Lipingzhangella rawalii TaxID=2055835 RepID=A0ABU2H4Z5_9ACTN|nr:DUF3168 domain-containing protein [Lipingzhangella rawalii]MDS1269689.1 DUF3168 domain-containing protein [Lipingzhangella rawalii]
MPSTIARSPLLAIQDAIRQRLESAPDLGAEVYEYVEPEPSYPHVLLGAATEEPDNTHGAFGRQCTHTVQVWSQQPGLAEAKQVADRVTQLLDHQPLELDGPWRVVVCAFAEGHAERDPDSPDLTRVTATFRIVTSQAAQ